MVEGDPNHFRLPLGLEGDLASFAKATGSDTYIQRAGGGLFIPEKFEKMAAEASEINFNFSKFSIGKYVGWIRDGKPYLPGNATNIELEFILSNPATRQKTNFFVHPQPIGR